MSALEVIELPEAEPDRQENRRRAYTPEEAVALAKVWARETGAPPTRDAWDINRRKRRLRTLYERCKHIEGEIARYETGGYPSIATIRKLYGTWNAFIAVCGWEPRDRTRPRIGSAYEPPVTPTSDQKRRGAGLHLDERRRKALAEREADVPAGPTTLMARLRAVSVAQKDGDTDWLAGELDSLAAAAIAWADKLRANAVRADERNGAAAS